MKQVFIHLATTKQDGATATENYGPFSPEEAETKLVAIGWTPQGNIFSGTVWWTPPCCEGKEPNVGAKIVPLVAELPETIEVVYKEPYRRS